MSSTANTTVTTIDSKKPNTKQELIAANIKLLIEQLEAGHSDALTNYLTAMSRFHNYSFGNVLEIARQMPDRDPRCRVLDVEEPWPQREGRAERHSHSCPHRRRSPQEGRGSREGHHQAERARLAWLPQCLCLRRVADRRRRPARVCAKSPATPARTSTVWPRSSKSRASSLSITRTLPPRSA